MVMACPFFHMPGGPCSSVNSSVDGFSVVLDRHCWRRVVRISFYNCSIFGTHAYFFWCCPCCLGLDYDPCFDLLCSMFCAVLELVLLVTLRSVGL